MADAYASNGQEAPLKNIAIGGVRRATTADPKDRLIPLRVGANGELLATLVEAYIIEHGVIANHAGVPSGDDGAEIPWWAIKVEVQIQLRSITLTPTIPVALYARDKHDQATWYLIDSIVDLAAETDDLWRVSLTNPENYDRVAVYTTGAVVGVGAAFSYDADFVASSIGGGGGTSSEDFTSTQGGVANTTVATVAGRDSLGNAYALKVATDGTLQTSGSADFTSTVGAAANTTVAQIGLKDDAGLAMAQKGNATTGAGYTSPPQPDAAETITAVTGADPVTGEMVAIDVDTREIVFESWPSVINSATAIRTVFFGESRFSGKILAIPGADFTTLETTPMLPYRWSPGGVIGMMFSKIGARFYYTDGGSGAPTMTTKFQQQK